MVVEQKQSKLYLRWIELNADFPELCFTNNDIPMYFDSRDKKSKEKNANGANRKLGRHSLMPNIINISCQKQWNAKRRTIIMVEFFFSGSGLALLDIIWSDSNSRMCTLKHTYLTQYETNRRSSTVLVPEKSALQ